VTHYVKFTMSAFTTKSEYDVDKAKWLLTFAQYPLTIDNPRHPDIQTLNEKINATFRVVKLFSPDYFKYGLMFPIEAYVFWNMETVVLSFVGCKNVAQVGFYFLSDFVGVQHQDGMYIHDGFYKSIHAIGEYATKAITPYVEMGKEFYVTGYSLGAVMGDMFTMFYMDRLRTVLDTRLNYQCTYVFAKPPWFLNDAEANEKYRLNAEKNDVWTTIHHRDIVALNFVDAKRGFKHKIHCMFVMSDNVYTETYIEPSAMDDMKIMLSDGVNYHYPHTFWPIMKLLEPKQVETRRLMVSQNTGQLMFINMFADRLDTLSKQHVDKVGIMLKCSKTQTYDEIWDGFETKFKKILEKNM